MKFFQETNVQPASLLSNKVSNRDIENEISFDITAHKPTMYIAETGWPSVCNDPSPLCQWYIYRYRVFNLGILRHFQREQRCL
jgi:hypothetical protein